MASEEQPLITSEKERKEPAYNCVALSLVLAGIVFIFGAVLAAGVVIGWRVVGSSNAQQVDWGGTVSDGGRTVHVGDWLNDFISAANIEDNLKYVRTVCTVA